MAPTYYCYDATSGHHPPSGYTVAAGYIISSSEAGDAYHAWTDPDWASATAELRLPIFVQSHPGSAANGVSDAKDVLAWLTSRHVPKGCTIALDLETAVDSAYVKAYDAELHGNGYLVMIYGSYSTIFSNPKTSGGIWDAAYTYVAHLSPNAGVVATQFSDKGNNGEYDESLILQSVPLWKPSSNSPWANGASILTNTESLTVLRHHRK